MKNFRRCLAVLLALALLTAMGAAAGITAAGDNELPIIPINPHTHTWDEGTVTQAPTCTEAGVTTYHCTTCTSGVKTEPISPLGHDYVGTVTAPDCTACGFTTYTCSRCGDSYVADETDPLGHDYAAVVTEPTCTAGGYTTYTCTRCGDSYVADETDPLGHDYVAAVTPPTCTAAGYTTYTCSRCGETCIADETEPLGHTPGAPAEENRVEPSCTAPGGYDTVTCCAICGAELSRVHTDLPALGHNWDGGVVQTVPTCTGGGVTVYTCLRCGETKQEAASAAGHTAGEAAVENEVAPTCTAAGGYDTVVRCTVCGAILSSEHTELLALGHDYVDAVTAPTCLESGYTTYTCSRCGDSYVADETDPLGHEYEAAVTEPTCTENGYTTYTCSRCGDSYAADVVDPLGHDYAAVVTEPTCTAGGYTTYTCTRCQDSYVADETEPAPHQFENGVCTVCGAEDPDYVSPITFEDVPEDAYYAAPVAWAAAKGITTGTSATTFSPDKTCTRAQVVTFLWRAKGSPEPAGGSNPFGDVTADAYYYKAVLWAVEQGITTGTSTATFSPDKPCTRAQVVTFLWRAEGKPASTRAVEPGENETPVMSENTFTDVQDGAYYAEAVRWAVAKGITNGTSATTFSPDKPCTRGQIVTFLYRDMA